MKTILLLSTLFIFGFTGISYAQLEEGNLMLGTDIGSGITNTTSNGLFSLDFGLNDGAGYDLGLSPKAGYFLNDNLVLGAIINLGLFKVSPKCRPVYRNLYLWSAGFYKILHKTGGGQS
jgi:hypothetical protein